MRGRFHFVSWSAQGPVPSARSSSSSAQEASRRTILMMPDMKWFNAGVIDREMSVSEKDVLAALSTVMDPELNIDLVRAGMVKDLKVEGSNVKLKIELTTPACPLKGKIEADA